MPEIIETTVYGLNELSDTAKDKARAWYRDGGFDYDWYDAVYEDFQRIAEILGIRFKTRTARLMGGGSRQEPCIWFRGFWSQGDGACSRRTVMICSSVNRLRFICPSFIRGRTLTPSGGKTQWQVTDVGHRGHYYHEYCMEISVERASPNWQEMTADAEDVVTEALRDLARWFYRQLEREYDYLSSDEVVDETILANGYTFTKVGARFG